MNLIQKLWNRIVPDVYYGTIAGQRTRFEIDRFSSGCITQTHYPTHYRKYVELAKDVYVIEDAISKIGKIVSQVNFVSDRPQDKIVKLLNNPNDKQSEQEFLKEFSFYIKSAGWTVIWKKYKSFGNIEGMQLINLNPDKTSFTDTGDIETEYEEKEERIKLDDVIIFYDSIRESNNKGYSVLKPLRSQVNNILDAQRAKGIQIEKSGTTIVSPKVATAANPTDEGLNSIVHPDVPGHQSQKQQIEDKLNTRGLENNIIVSSKGLDALSLAQGLNAFDFNSTVEPDAIAIYSALGVDVELTPYGKNNTYENKAVAELKLVQSEAIPLVNNLINSLKSEFNSTAIIEGKFDHLDCMSIVEKRMQETKTVRIEHVITLQQNNLIDENKAKEMLKDIIG